MVYTRGQLYDEPISELLLVMLGMQWSWFTEDPFEAFCKDGRANGTGCEIDDSGRTCV